jgi:sortase A
MATPPPVIEIDFSAKQQHQTKPPEATATPITAAPITRIVAESIDLDASVIQVGWVTWTTPNGVQHVWQVADFAAGWHKNSALPGEGGNIVLSAHHNMQGEVFRNTVKLSVGDKVTLYEGEKRFDYQVSEKFIVKDLDEPEEVQRANARWIGPFDEERLTLVTCWPYIGNTHRVIVIAKPVTLP